MKQNYFYCISHREANGLNCTAVHSVYRPSGPSIKDAGNEPWLITVLHGCYFVEEIDNPITLMTT